MTEREHVVETAPDAADPRLRSRVYSIPFEDVWQSALALARGGLRGWTLLSADDESGTIRAEAVTLLFKAHDDVTVRIGLDDEAQTRVDVRSEPRMKRGGIGRNTKRVVRFFAALEKRLGQKPPRPPLYPSGTPNRDPPPS